MYCQLINTDLKIINPASVCVCVCLQYTCTLHTLCTPKLHSCIVARCGLLRVLCVLCKVNMYNVQKWQLHVFMVWLQHDTCVTYNNV